MFWIFWTFWIFLDELVFLHEGEVFIGGVAGDEMRRDLQGLVRQGYGVKDYGAVFEDVLYHAEARFVYYFRLDKFPCGGEDDGMLHVGFYEGGVLLAEAAIPRCGSREDIPHGFEFVSEFFHCCKFLNFDISSGVKSRGMPFSLINFHLLHQCFF